MSEKTNVSELSSKARNPRQSARIWAYVVSMESDIYAIRRYIDTVASSFDREIKNYENYIEKRIKDAPDDDAIQWLSESLGEAQEFLIDHFPSFALETTFVATYTLLEDEMLEIARRVGRHLGINLDPMELSGNPYIRRAKKYLEKLCGITVPNNQRWEQVIMHGLLRNLFAHRRGRVNEGNKDVRDYVERKKPIISINEHNRLKLSKEFCMEVLDNVEALLNDLYKLAQKNGL